MWACHLPIRARFKICGMVVAAISLVSLTSTPSSVQVLLLTFFSLLSRTHTSHRACSQVFSHCLRSLSSISHTGIHIQRSLLNFIGQDCGCWVLDQDIEGYKQKPLKSSCLFWEGLEVLRVWGKLVRSLLGSFLEPGGHVN